MQHVVFPQNSQTWYKMPDMEIRYAKTKCLYFALVLKTTKECYHDNKSQHECNQCEQSS
jgi:hypothetical protein